MIHSIGNQTINVGSGEEFGLNVEVSIDDDETVFIMIDGMLTVITDETGASAIAGLLTEAVEVIEEIQRENIKNSCKTQNAMRSDQQRIDVFDHTVPADESVG